MITKKKSRLLPIFTLLFILFFVVACGGAPTESSSESEPAAPAAETDTEEAAEEPAAEEPTEEESSAEEPAAEETTEEAAEEPAEATGIEATLVLATEGSPPTFDPLSASDSRVDTPSINLYNALVQVVPGTTELEMDLAESIEPSEDGLTYTTILKEGVLFHDGSELTAEDVKYTIDRMLELQLGAYRGLTPIIGAEVVDDYTVDIQLDAPFPGVLQAMTRLYILNAELVQANEADGDWGQTWLQTNDAGSGPYTLTAFQPEQQFTIQSFPDYFKGWEGNHVDRAIFQVIKEQSTRRLALENGDADWIAVGSADTWDALNGQDGIVVNSDVTLNQLYFAFNTQNEFLQDARVRQALAMVYDYEGHVQQARNGRADVARGPLPPAIPCFDEAMIPSATDIETAKQLMADAGYPDGGFDLEMAYQGTAPEETSAVQIWQAGAAELGVNIVPVAVEWPAKVDLFSSQETAPGMGTIWIFPAYPDPDQFLFRLGHSTQAGSAGLNFAYYENARMDELLDTARSELDEEARCDLYKEAQQIWVEDTPYADVVIGHALSAQRDYVQGYVWTPSHAFTQNIYEMSLDGKS